MGRKTTRLMNPPPLLPAASSARAWRWQRMRQEPLTLPLRSFQPRSGMGQTPKMKPSLISHTVSLELKGKHGELGALGCLWTFKLTFPAFSPTHPCPKGPLLPSIIREQVYFPHWIYTFPQGIAFWYDLNEVLWIKKEWKHTEEKHIWSLKATVKGSLKQNPRCRTGRYRWMARVPCARTPDRVRPARVLLMKPFAYGTMPAWLLGFCLPCQGACTWMLSLRCEL